MSVQATVPLLFAQQMGPAGRLAHDLATHPEASQNMARQLTEAMLRQESQQVQKLEDSDSSPAIRDEERQRRGSAEQERQRRKSEDREEDSSPLLEAPHLGLLLKCKI